jgi:anti-sigma B factor antagonist
MRKEQEGQRPNNTRTPHRVLIPNPREGDFTVGETWVDRLVVISVSGSVDTLSAPWLTEAIDSEVAKRPTGMVVDLSDVEFLASAGMSVLLAALGSADHSGRFVVADGPATHRPQPVGSQRSHLAS